MKEYIEQFYNEGLATTFYLKPINSIKKKIKNKSMLKFISILIKILYTIFALVLAWFIFLDRYPAYSFILL